MQRVTCLFLDTAPVIYYVEKNPNYLATTSFIFDMIENGVISAVTSPVTLAECLVMPFRSGLIQLQQNYVEAIGYGRNTIFSQIDAPLAEQAAQVRAKYNILLPDALQIATALINGCDTFLTNDKALQRVTELRVLLLGDLEA